MSRRCCLFPTTPSSQRHLCALSVSVLSFSSLFLFRFNVELSTACVVCAGEQRERSQWGEPANSSNSLRPKSFAIRTSKIFANNPFRIRTFKTQDLKSCRIRIYRKSGSGRGLIVNRARRRSRQSGRGTIHRARLGVEPFDFQLSTACPEGSRWVDSL